MDEYLDKRLSLSLLPTPIIKLERFSEKIGKSDLYMKRDDLTGIELSGNKVRKLEYILYDALQKNVDIIISCGDAQSNHLRSCAAAAVKLGMKPHHVIWGEKPCNETGNFLMDCLMGVDFTYYNGSSIEDMNGKMEEIADEYRRKGRNPFVVPLGANMPLGVLGYFNAVKELKEQLKALDMMPDYLVVTVGTGSTYLGLMLGIRHYQLPIKLIGVTVISKDYDYTESLSQGYKEFCSEFGFKEPFHKEDINILTDYVGTGYGVQQEDVMSTIRYLAQTEGIILDYAYTGKAMLGLVQEIQQRKLEIGSKVLFWNTGGIFEIFK